MVGCTSSAAHPPLPDGVWVLETVTIPVDGDVAEYAGTDADTQPWIAFDPEIRGHSGCNRISQAGEPPPTWDGQHLSTLRFLNTAAGCVGPTEAIEAGLVTTMRHPDGIDVAFMNEGETMVWQSASGTTVTFRLEH